MKRIVAIVLAVAVVAGGTFAYLKVFGSTPAVDRAIGLVPEEAFFYTNLFVDPSNDQKRALRDLIEKFPQFEDTEDATSRLFEQLDIELEPLGLTFDRDIKPALGKQVAMFVAPDEDDDGEPEVGLMVAVKDRERAEAAIDKAIDKSGAEVTDKDGYSVLFADEADPFAFGMLDDFLVGGTERALQSMLSLAETEGTSLVDSQTYRDAVDGLAGDPVASFFLDGDGLLAELKAEGDLPPETERLLRWLPGFDGGTIASTVTLAGDNVAWEVAASLPSGGPVSGLLDVFRGDRIALGDLPESGWLALGVPDLGGIVSAYLDVAEEAGADVGSARSDFSEQTGLDLDAVSAWLGDTRFFARGKGLLDIGVAVTADSSNADETLRAVDVAREKIAATGVPVEDADRGDLRGFTVRAGFPATVLGGDRLIAALGGLATNEALAPEETLGDDEEFQRASDELGGRYTPRLYIDARRAIEFGEAVASAQLGGLDRFYASQVKPYLDHLAHVVLGVTVEDDKLFAKLVIGVR